MVRRTAPLHRPGADDISLSTSPTRRLQDFYYNTTLVNPKEFKSYWDLVAPEVEGQVRFPGSAEHGSRRWSSVHVLSSRVGTGVYQTAVRRHAADLGARPPANYRLVGARKISALRRVPRDDEAKSQGLPVDEFDNVDWKEGFSLTTGGGSMSLIKGGPNPNAAKVFVNWFLSRRGQIAMQKYNDLYGEDAPNSRRIDIPKDMLVPNNRMIPGKKYFDVSDPKYADMTPMFNLVKEIMKGREERKD